MIEQRSKTVTLYVDVTAKYDEYAVVQGNMTHMKHSHSQYQSAYRYDMIMTLSMTCDIDGIGRSHVESLEVRNLKKWGAPVRRNLPSPSS